MEYWLKENDNRNVCLYPFMYYPFNGDVSIDLDMNQTIFIYIVVQNCSE